MGLILLEASVNTVFFPSTGRYQKRDQAYENYLSHSMSIRIDIEPLTTLVPVSTDLISPRPRLWNITYISSFLVPQPGTWVNGQWSKELVS